MSVLVMKFVLREWMGCFNMFLGVSGCFWMFQVYFPIYSTMGRIWFNSFRCFLLYLVYRYQIGKIWL